MHKPRIKKINKIVPDAYHGTSLEFARKIVDTKEFLIDKSKDHYLGDGVYFFESSLSNAIYYAGNRNKFIGVIKSQINLGNCLDLHDREHLEFVFNTAQSLKKRKGVEITDAFVINFIASMGDIDTVRATYIATRSGRKREKIFSGSRFYHEQQLMICVRRQENILSYTLCYQAEVKND